MAGQSAIPVYEVRGYPVAHDSDVADRFGTKTGRFNQTIRRNIDRILDTIADDEEGTTVREEGRAILTKSLGAIRAHLDAKGIANHKTVAEIRKTLTEIEAIDTDIIARQIEADHRRLAYLAKQMQMDIAAQTCLETGEATGFLETLRAISGE